MPNKQIKFAFFGTGDFAVGVLEKLIENGYVPDVVVTAPDRPKGRKLVMTPPPVKSWIMNHESYNIKILQPEKLDESFKVQVSSSKTHELFLVADYGKIIPKKILDIPKHGAINVHPSLLPKFRGSSPIQSFILSGQAETGVTLILMDEKMDHGPILALREFPISNFQFPNNFQSSNVQISEKTQTIKHKNLESALSSVGGELLVSIIPDFVAGKVKPVEQAHEQATFTKMIKKEDGLIDYGDLTVAIEGKNSEKAEENYRKVLAYTPWPGAYFFLPAKNESAAQKRVIITDAKTENGKLIILRVKPEGKNEMSWEDFLRGNK